MKEVTIGNIKLVDLERMIDGLKLFKLAEEHRDDDFPEHPVPNGFIVNGASVPKFLRDIISPTGELFRASVPHDYFYATKVVSRATADRIFRKIVLDDTGNAFLAWGAWLVLRLFGRSFWKKAGTVIEQVYLEA